MFEKHQWKSDILNKDTSLLTLPQVFFEHVARKNQLPGLSVSGTLVEKGLNILISDSKVLVDPNLCKFQILLLLRASL